MDMNLTSNQTLFCRFDQKRNTSAGTLKVYKQTGKRKTFVQSQSASKNNGDKPFEISKKVKLGAWRPPLVSNTFRDSRALALVNRNCLYIYHTGD